MTNADRIRAMTDADDFIFAQACAAMGLDENGPAFWKEHIHVTKDIQSGEEIKCYKDGWYCSRCGKWSNYRAKQCSGCGTDMREADND